MTQKRNELHLVKQVKADKIQEIQKERQLHEKDKSLKPNFMKNYMATIINLTFLVLAVLMEALILSKIISVVPGTIIIVVLVICSFLVSSLLGKSKKSNSK